MAETRTPPQEQQEEELPQAELAALAAALALLIAQAQEVEVALLLAAFLAATLSLGDDERFQVSAEVADWITPPRPITPRTSELTRRALYGLNAARRIGRDVASGKSFSQAITKERRNLELHKFARARRTAAANMVDEAAKMYGDLLGWRAVLDDRTTPDCREAHNKNFYASRPPRRGIPGAVHPRCRCGVSAPIPGAPVLR